MKGRSFDTFQVNPGNQEAYTVCRRIASLEEMGPSLVVLLGPEGCGKSHLLWSIAKQVRVGTLPAGLALITPNEIPEKVKGLVENAQPLQGRRAILLVDGLEHFHADIRRLDAIIETFLAYQHPVIVATSVHPNRLGRLSVPLVNRLTNARFVGIEGRLTDGDHSSLERIRTLEASARVLQRQRDEFEDQLTTASTALEAAETRLTAAQEHAKLQERKAEAAIRAQASLQQAYDAAKREKASMESRCAELEVEVERAREQRQRVAAVLQDARDERAVAEAQIASFREEAEYALAQQARMQGFLSDARMAAEEAESTTSTLEAAEQWIAEALRALATMPSLRVLTDSDESMEPSTDPEMPINTNNPLVEGLATLSRTQRQLRGSLAATRDRLKGVEFEWEKSRKVLAIQTAEMDALRYEAASQAAQASIQAGELEKRLACLEAALDSLRSNRPAGGGDGSPAGKSWSMALENMQAQLLALREARALERQEFPADDQALFDADFFEALPADFEADQDSNGTHELPGDDRALKEALEEVLGGPEEDVEEEGKDVSIDFG